MSVFDMDKPRILECLCFLVLHMASLILLVLSWCIIYWVIPWFALCTWPTNRSHPYTYVNVFAFLLVAYQFILVFPVLSRLIFTTKPLFTYLWWNMQNSVCVCVCVFLKKINSSFYRHCLASMKEHVVERWLKE